MVAGCGGGTSSHLEPGGPDAASACAIPAQTSYLKTNRTIGKCPPAASPACSSTLFSGPPLLTSDDLQPGAHFVAVSGEYLLAETASMEPLVVRMHPEDAPVAYSFAAPLAAGQRAVDLDGNYVLTCSTSDCRVFRREGLSLYELPAPPMTDATKVVDWLSQDAVCVVGDGASCFDGTAWHELVPKGQRFAAASATLSAIWLAGEGGHVALATWSCVEAIESGTDADLTSISADTQRELWAVVSGKQGALSYVSPEESVSCNVSSTSPVVLRDWGRDWGWDVADQHDQQWIFGESSVLRGKPAVDADWCVSEIGEPALDVTSFDCGVAENVRVLTSTRLLGNAQCALD